MGFPEPPNYAGDKRIFMAEQFYDVTHPVRTKIYRAYIRKCLENLAGHSNVIHLISGEYSGPLHFTQFWIDTIAQWQKETGKDVLVGLAVPKDAQDAILADPARAAVVDVIVIRYWWYQNDGQTYAPGGGQNLAPRQFMRIMPNKPSSFVQVNRAVREYREKYPDKAVVYSPWTGDAHGWASLLAGGSLPGITTPVPNDLLAILPKLKSFTVANQPADTFAMTDGPPIEQMTAQNYLLYCNTGDLPSASSTDAYEQHRFDVGDGKSLLWLSKK
jgi:hypothetical protein